MKENTPGFCFSGFLIMMLIPRLMNGLEKSITRSRMEEMVSGAMAKSAVCNRTTAAPNVHISHHPVKNKSFARGWPTVAWRWPSPEPTPCRVCNGAPSYIIICKQWRSGTRWRLALIIWKKTLDVYGIEVHNLLVNTQRTIWHRIRYLLNSNYQIYKQSIVPLQTSASRRMKQVQPEKVCAINLQHGAHG